MLKFTVLCCIVSCVFASTEDEIIYGTLNGNIKLECEGDDLTWKTKSNATALEFVDIPQVEDMKTDDNTLTIKKLTEDELGYYACFDSDQNKIKEFKVEIRYKIKKMAASVSVNKGDTTAEGDMECSTLGDHDVVFRWYTRPEGSEEDSDLTQICGYEGDNCNPELEMSDPQLSELKDDMAVTTPAPFLERLSVVTRKDGQGYTSQLRISNAQLEDRAVYVCRAIAEESKNDEDLICDESPNCEEVFTLLRVKDPLAAVWPFIGIVAEVVILCLVILFCERRRKDEDKEDIDEDRYTGNNISSNNSLRQRK